VKRLVPFVLLLVLAGCFNRPSSLQRFDKYLAGKKAGEADAMREFADGKLDSSDADPYGRGYYLGYRIQSDLLKSRSRRLCDEDFSGSR
jgi:hypothetical protein